MTTRLFSKVLLIAAVAGFALALTPATTTAAERGFCTGNLTVHKSSNLMWRTSSGKTLPTALWCYETRCPPKC